jgi:glycosyltransferase involved in cell wall biosynthesis
VKPAVAILRSAWVAGGAERYLMDLGDALDRTARVHFVTIENEAPVAALRILGREKLGSLFEAWPADAAAIEHRARQFDLFINAASGLLVAGRARRNWLVVFSPGPPEGPLWPLIRRTATRILCRAIRSRRVAGLAPSPLVRRFALYPTGSVGANLATYEKVIAISRYVAAAITRRWSIESEVLYPGVDTETFKIGPSRAQAIISVGRFAPYGNLKQHSRLIEAFGRIHPKHPDWILHLVGSLEDSDECRRYLEGLRVQACPLPIQFHPNLDLLALRTLYSTSSLYWHAAGVDADPVREPDRVEQFGIALVEAMASGAIPIAYAAGGALEIIEDGRSGFLWRRLEDLVETTKGLIASSCARVRMAEAATLRSRDFDVRVLGETVRRWYEKADSA